MSTECNISWSQILIIIALVILLILAIYWEAKDIIRLDSRKPIDRIKNLELREKELHFYACFNSENNIQWRGIYIMSFVVTLLISYLISEFYSDKCFDVNLSFLVFGSIVLVFYIGNVFRSFHVYRPMCSKVRCDKTIL